MAPPITYSLDEWDEARAAYEMEAFEMMHFLGKEVEDSSR